MPMPTDVPIIDTMVGFPTADRKQIYKFLAPELRDTESLEQFRMPAEYMFKDVPKNIDPDIDPVAVTLHNMDTYNVAQAMVSVSEAPERAHTVRAVTDHADRFIPATEVDPRDGMEAVRKIVRLHEAHGLKAVTTFPAGYRTAINDRAYYPIYAKCVELDLPIFSCTGVPGPRVPMEPQTVAYIDDVCWFFPDLRFVMRHGAQPDTELAVKLMLKWPNLYYSTSAFAPKHYDPHILDYANSRGADKVLYAGYFPAGLTYERIMSELPDVPLKDEVWPKFLRENAQAVLKLA
ncbi:MAG: amidohydrolase family protein [Acidimicrobiales bacterium]